MRTLETWLVEYSDDHQNKRNQKIHKICVPLIFATVVGALHFIPFGDFALVAATIWYATLGFKALALMLLQLAVALAIVLSLHHFVGLQMTWAILVAVFTAAWFGQFYGHKLEGRKPSFFKDLQYLLVGPLWVWLGH